MLLLVVIATMKQLLGCGDRSLEMRFRHMDPDFLKLIGLHRAEFERAKADQTKAWIAEAMVAVLAALSSFSRQQVIVFVFALAALCLVVTKFVYWHRSRHRRSVAESVRRRLHLSHGLGMEVKGKELTDLIAKFSATDQEGQRFEDKNYFSEVKQGPRGLALAIQESSFWSKHLLRDSAKLFATFSAASIALLIAVLLISPLLYRGNAAITVARIVCIALSLTVTLDFIGSAVAFWEAADYVSALDDRIENALSSGALEPSVLALFCDYNVAVQEAPMIPTVVYMREEERLHKLWHERTKS